MSWPALSPIDAFFVAYQQASGASMMLGAAIDLDGTITRDDVVSAVGTLLDSWPQIGAKATPRLLGMAWRGTSRPDDLVSESPDPGALDRFREVPIEPTGAPPFEALWVPRADGTGGVVGLRAHHSLADGEGFIELCRRFTEALGRRCANNPAPTPQVVTGVPAVVARRRARKRLLGMWRYSRWLTREAKADRCAHVAGSWSGPGPVATHQLLIVDEALERLRASARATGVSMSWWVGAAWLRSLYAFNVARDRPSPSLLSLEVPVSLRRSRGELGNLVSALLVLGDAQTPLPDLARTLQRMLRQAIREGAHEAGPFFAAPARLLPWWLFRRVAVNPTTTGFATSHFNWLTEQTDPADSITESSGGALRLVDQRYWTPVCLKMGVALSALFWPGRMQLGLSYSRAAMDADAAAELADLLVGELDRVSVAAVAS